MNTTRRCLMLLALAFCLVTMLTLPALARRCQESYNPEIDPDAFVDDKGDPLPIDNKDWPMVPGTTFVYEAETDDETELNLVTITHDTKVVTGVTCVVVFDREYEDDLLTEKTWDWYAQDDHGNIWYFGEKTEAYEYDDDGNLIDTSTEGAWEAGIDGALPGIIKMGKPRPGTSYRQEYLEGEAEDMGKVLSLRAKVNMDFGTFRRCMKTKEWTPLDRGNVEHKCYAPGVGLVLIAELKGKTKYVELVGILVE
jgi:hypothetical protein